ncbi:hypothetical protein [Falsiroseomonas sp.]|uniref:hypothetical protein n=1 Tax=Falsiroseomonas sp. TaxID=2870721 RepID=UPI0035654D25
MTKQPPVGTRQDETPPRTDGKRQGEPTPQGYQAAGPGNLHGVPPDDAPGEPGAERVPFHPDAGRPAEDTEAMAQRVLDQARRGPPAKGDAGPLAAGQTEGSDDDDQP